MTAGIALIVLFAALLHATWNATVKSGKDHLLSIAGLNAAGALIAFVLIPVVGLPDVESWPYLLASVVIHSGYYIALSEAYKHGDFSQAYPVARGTAPILVTLWGVFVLNEVLTTIEVFSLIGVVTGILIFATRSFGQVLQDRRALMSALITSMFIGAYTIVDGIGGRLSGNVPGYMVWLSALDWFPVMVYAVYKRGISKVVEQRFNWKILFLGAALALASYSLVVWSMTQAPIPMVSALRETSIIIAALIGAYYFKEPSGKRRIVASVVIFFSVALLAVDKF
jgi:drug/metabolite transporter (DMT)-like permease